MSQEDNSYMVHKVSMEFAGRTLTLETGRLAKQADAAVLASYGETQILVTACVTDEPTDLPFLPLRVDFEEKMYSVGRIPGGFFKREGKPSDEAVIIGRSVDRPIRPLLPEGLRNDVQVIVNPLSVDPEGSVSVVSMIAAAAALHISRIPFNGPFAAVNIGRVDGELVVNPAHEARGAGEFDLLAAITRDGVVELEMEGVEVPESTIREALQMAFDAAQPVLDLIDQFREVAGAPKADFPLWEPDAAVYEFIKSGFGDRISATVEINDKAERNAVAKAIRKEIIEGIADELKGKTTDIDYVIEKIQKDRLQQIVIDEGRRADGRAFDEIRELNCDVGLTARTHGSGLFERGDTQVLTLTTLGARRDQRMVRTLEGEEEYTRFSHHYNFPPFSVGEVRGLRAPGRREVGHGALAGKAIEAVLPPEDEFPYTVRCVSEVFGGDASTSMASACASTLSLMDAGVPIKAPVAGIAIGLVLRDPENFRVFVDMQAIEDFLGHMDFKVAGTREGVNAIQVDTKLPSLPLEVCFQALDMAREARLKILDTMALTLPYPREELSAYAPRMISITIPVERIGLLIGPGGRMIREIQAEYEVEIDVEDDGTVLICGEDKVKTEAARKRISDMTRDVEVGEVFTGRVTSVTPFGAFVEIIPGRDGLVHISHLAWEHVDRTEDVCKVGDEMTVKVIEIDDEGKVRLSRKELLPREPGQGSSGGGSRDRGPRSGGGSRDRGPSRGGRDRGPRSGGGASSGPAASAAPAIDKTGGEDEMGDFEAGRGKAYFRDKKR